MHTMNVSLSHLRRRDWIVIGLFGGLILTAVTIIVVLAYFMHMEYFLRDRIYPHVYIDSINIGQKTKKDARDMLAQRRDFSQVDLTVLLDENPVATFSAEQLALKTNAGVVVEQAFIIGRTPHLPSRVYQKIFTILGWEQYDFATRIEYNDKSIRAFVRQMEKKYNKSPQDALFSFEDGVVGEFRKEESGQRVNSDVFMGQVDKAIQTLSSSGTTMRVPLVIEDIHPTITLDDINEFGIEELIGEGQSDYSGSIPDRIYNIHLASAQFHGVLVPPGEEFSFNEHVGDISKEQGYRTSYIIKDGKTELGDGGGVCQVSTTILRATLDTGLPIVEHHFHAYRVGYYENDSQPGLDATIYTPSVDFRFLNDTPGHILIQRELDEENNLLRFLLFGKSDGRESTISAISVTNQSPPPDPHYQDDPSLPLGQVKQIDFAAPGAHASYSYTVIRDGEVHFEKNFYAVYRPWKAVYLVGKRE